MNKIVLSTTLLSFLMVGSSQAQDIYKVQQFSATDLNGDARFVGLGGAMGALGANISAMNSNPASAGLYRRGDMSITGSLLHLPGDPKLASYLGTNLRKASLDQLGFVYPLFVDGENLKFLNLGFNYRKMRNFHNLLNVDNAPLPKLLNPNRGYDNSTYAGVSQTWQLVDLAHTDHGFLNLDTEEGAKATSPMSALAADIRLIEPKADPHNLAHTDSRWLKIGQVSGYEKINAEAYHLRRATWGSVDVYDFNLSANYNDRFYIGANIGLYTLDFRTSAEYQELALNNAGEYFLNQDKKPKTYLMQQQERVTGTGVDAKFGFLVRPWAESSFRLGLSVTTPVFYMLNATNYVYMESPVGGIVEGKSYEYIQKDAERNYDYRMRTPWKVNVSLGTTVGHRLALGAEYEFSDHLTGQIRHLGNGFTTYDSSNGTIDNVQEANIDQMLRDTHTLRVGAEWRFSPVLYGRVGYNFVTSPQQKDAFLRLYSNSPSLYNAMHTDYVNLGNTHRFSWGLGYRSSDFYIDLAYQHQQQKADIYPFFYDLSGVAGTQNAIPAANATWTRNQLSLTLGYRF